MPRIDPNQLLKCLSALLGASGGIKSTLEVKRIATLMTKFSKKLVSKCIYIQILKSTQSDLLVEFMAEGGWALVFLWLDDAIVNNNYPLIREILELLLLCPISLDRLKENNCPKVVKGLSKDSEDEQVKQLAGKLVEQWLKFIKSGQAAISDVAMAQAAAAAALGSKPTTTTTTTATLSPKTAVVKPLPAAAVLTTEVIKKVPAIRKIGNKIKVSPDDEKSSSDEEVPPIGSLPLYKITVRDGKSVLAKVGTKTLTIPPQKKPESGGNAETVTAVVLKSDAGSKKFRYVAKVVPEKSDVSEVTSDDSSSREKVDEAKSEKTESKSDESESSEKEKSKTSSGSKNLVKDLNKSKDGHSKSKSHRDREKEKSDSRHKEKDRSSKDSDKDRRKSSDHKSHKSEKDRERDKSKYKDSKHEKSSSRDKDKKDAKPEKILSVAEKAQIQADKDKDTLEKLKTPAISSLGKIPKKSTSQSSNNSTPSSSSKNNSSSNSSEKSNNSDSKKSGEVKKVELKGPKPKTVKTFNSKFRSTGLEEEIKPPPPRSSINKKKPEEKKPVIVKPEVSPTSLKHPSSSPKDGKDGSPPEKKPKLAEVIAEKKDKIADKPGGIKLIPPKPKPALLESDMFSDALTASTKLEPRKRKRRTSSSKDGPDVKKEPKEESTSGSQSPKEVKPNLKFYRDTLEDDDEKIKDTSDIKSEIKTESDSEESKQTTDGDESGPTSKLYPHGVLVHKSRKGPKKSVKWKEESDLINVKYFELDETERVNVTRNFVDMKLMERSHEREAFQLARKISSDDIMEEKIPYGPLYEVDIPAERRPAVEPGRASEEKNVQYAREKTVLQAIYFHRSAIPDSPAEPDPENHPTTDPKIIPLEDITGNADSVSNFTNMPWPEPKPTLIPSSPPPTQTVAPTAVGTPGFAAGYSTVGNFAGFPPMGMPGVMPTGQGTWRTPDGKEMPMPMNFQPNGPMCPPQMGQPNMFPTDGFNMNGPGMPGFNPAFAMGCDPSMYGAPPMGGMNPGGPPPQWGNQRGWGPGPGPRGPPMNMQGKYPKGVCHQFAKFGNCSRGNNCRFMHPGVNCPPIN